MKPARPGVRIKSMTTHDTTSALLAGALAGYLLAEFGPRLLALLTPFSLIWS